MAYPSNYRSSRIPKPAPPPPTVHSAWESVVKARQHCPVLRGFRRGQGATSILNMLNFGPEVSTSHASEGLPPKPSALSTSGCSCH